MPHEFVCTASQLPVWVSPTEMNAVIGFKKHAFQFLVAAKMVGASVCFCFFHLCEPLRHRSSKDIWGIQEPQVATKLYINIFQGYCPCGNGLRHFK